MLTPVCPLLFNACLAEILCNLRILQRRGGILSRPYRLFWSSKYFTPFRTVMSTPGSRCKPPANRTRTPDFHNKQNRNSRESSTFPIIFFPAWRRKLWDSHSFSMIKYTTSSLSYFHLSLLFFAPTSMFSIDNYMYVINQKEKKKKACFSNALVTLSTTFLFFIRTFTSFNLFRSWLCFALYIFLNNSWDFIFQFDILETVTQV